MPYDSSGYLQFTAVASAWAQEVGLPPDMMVGRLCEWAVAGGFPEGALVTSAGQKIPPLEILTAFRLVIGNGQATMGDGTLHKDPAIALDQLRSVFVTGRDVCVFCERTSTRPPSFLRKRFRWRFWGIKGEENFAPPECPDIEERVAQESVYGIACAGLNNLRTTVSGLKGKNTRLGPRGGKDPVNVAVWQEKWGSQRDRVREDIERCGDQKLRQELEALEHEWRLFVAEQDAKAALMVADAAKDTALPESAALKEPRLRISKTARRGQLDGCELKLTPASFSLLRKLAEAAVLGKAAKKWDLVDQLLRPNAGDKALAQAVKRLKDQLVQSGISEESAEALILSRRAYGYELSLTAADIQIG